MCYTKPWSRLLWRFFNNICMLSIFSFLFFFLITYLLHVMIFVIKFVLVCVSELLVCVFSTFVIRQWFFMVFQTISDCFVVVYIITFELFAVISLVSFESLRLTFRITCCASFGFSAKNVVWNALPDIICIAVFEFIDNIGMVWNDCLHSRFFVWY